MFRCGKKVVEILPIDLRWAGHETDLTSGHEYKKIQIYNKLYELLTSSRSKVWKHWVQTCGCGRMSNLINLVLRWRHLTWPGGLTWYDLGWKFLHKMRKRWMNSYAKFGGTACRRDSAICEKPMGGAHMCPPPRARVKQMWAVTLRTIFAKEQLTQCNRTPTATGTRLAYN